MSHKQKKVFILEEIKITIFLSFSVNIEPVNIEPVSIEPVT